MYKYINTWLQKFREINSSLDYETFRTLFLYARIMSSIRKFSMWFFIYICLQFLYGKSCNKVFTLNVWLLHSFTCRFCFLTSHCVIWCLFPQENFTKFFKKGLQKPINIWRFKNFNSFSFCIFYIFYMFFSWNCLVVCVCVL